MIAKQWTECFFMSENFIFFLEFTRNLHFSFVKNTLVTYYMKYDLPFGR